MQHLCHFRYRFSPGYVLRFLSDLKVEGVEVVRVPGLANNQLDQLKALGKFDIIILKEVTHEIEELHTFLEAVRSMLKDDDGRIFLISHPKNPPVPLPDPAIPFWRKLAPNREEIIKAAKQVRKFSISSLVSSYVASASLGGNGSELLLGRLSDQSPETRLGQHHPMQVLPSRQEGGEMHG